MVFYLQNYSLAGVMYLVEFIEQNGGRLPRSVVSLKHTIQQSTHYALRIKNLQLFIRQIHVPKDFISFFVPYVCIGVTYACVQLVMQEHLQRTARLSGITGDQKQLQVSDALSHSRLDIFMAAALHSTTLLATHC